MNNNMENLTDKKIDDLTEEMHQGFDEMHQGFKNHDKRLDDLTDEMRQGFADSDKKIDDLALATNQGFSDVDKKFEAVYQKFTEIDQRFDRMEIENQERHNELMNSNDKMIKMFETNRQELVASKFITDKHEKQLEHHDKRIKILELSGAI